MGYWMAIGKIANSLVLEGTGERECERVGADCPGYGVAEEGSLGW